MSGVFISHSNADRAAAFALSEKLTEKGYRCFLDFESIVGGEAWEREIYAALRQSVVVLLYATPEAIKSQWVFAEVSIARFLGVPVIPMKMRGDDCEIWPHVEATVQYIDFRTHPGPAHEKLLESLAAFDLKEDAAFPSGQSPYPGLEAFHEKDASVFFGRERELHEALGELRPGGRQRRFLAVVGPSGSGKSSFVRAGLIPALTRGKVHGSRQWLYIPPFTPGDAPFRNFAQALCTADKNLGFVSEVEAHLRKEGGFLDAIVTALAHSRPVDAEPAGANVVVVLDQLEEIERRTPKSEANVFLESLRSALEAPNTPLIVITTLRSDFLSECLQFLALAPLLSSNSLLLGAMDRAALRAAILGPAELTALRFDDGLVDRIVEDTGGGDALPLMADALRQLWEKSNERTPRRITTEDYYTIGGVQEGLAQRAQKLFESIPPDSRLPLRDALVQLADVNERGDFTRRRLPRDQILRPAQAAIDQFVDNRLLISSGGKSSGWVEVSHEALLRNWNMLRQWLAEEIDRLRLRRQIEMDAQEWAAHDRAPDYVWRSGRLAAARELMEGERWPENDVRRQFLEESHIHEQTGRERESEQLAIRVLNDYEKDPHLGILLALAAIETYAWTPRSELALNITLDASRLRALLDHEDNVYSAAYSPDGSRIVTASDDHTARVWDATSGQPLHTLRGHENTVSSAAFSPDGSRIVTASNDNTVRVWDAISGQPLHTLQGHDDEVQSAAFSPDGSRIVTASDDHTARVWDAISGRHVHTLRGHEDRLLSAAFSPDGMRIVTASWDNTAKVWDATSGRHRITFLGHKDGVQSAAFSPDGSRIVTASNDNTAKVWDVTSGQHVHTLRGHEKIVLRAAFSPDGSRIVTASSDNTARVWDATSGQPLHTLRGHENWVRTAAFSPDGLRIVTASSDNTARVWYALSGQPLYNLRGHENTVSSAVFSPDGSRIVTASDDDTARVWDASSGQPHLTLGGHKNTVSSAAFSPNGSRIVTAAWDHTARVWDASSGQPLHNLRGHKENVESAAFSPDGSCIVTASWDGTARVWDAASGQPLHTLRGHGNGVLSAAFSPDGSRIVTSSWDRTARVWGADSGQPHLTLRGHEKGVLSAAFSPDGSRIVTASGDHTARVWDATSGQPLHTLLGYEDDVLSAAFSPDGSRIVTASGDHTARVWDVTSEQPLHTLGGHKKTVHSAAFSTDGLRIVTASADSTARVWDATSGQLLQTLRGHEGSVSSAAFSSDGLRIVTASLDNTARVWDALTRDGLVRFAHTRGLRGLTREERERYGLPSSDDRKGDKASHEPAF